MGFKSIEQFNEAKYGNRLILKNDGETARVIILYRNSADILIANAHYIKSAEYSGYVHCTGTGCPACAKGLRTQAKLFMPVYDIDRDEVLFFERDTKYFLEQLKGLMANYPNLSEFVFNITRHGEAGSRDTRYSITAIAKNSKIPYDEILARKSIKLPDYYETIIKDMTPAQISSILSPTSGYSGTTYGSADSLPDFVPQPRVTVASAETPIAAAAETALDKMETLGDLDGFEDLDPGETEF